MIDVGAALSPELKALVREPVDLCRVVADKEDDATGEKLEPDQLVDKRRRLGIEGGRGLVQQ